MKKLLIKSQPKTKFYANSDKNCKASHIYAF